MGAAVGLAVGVADAVVVAEVAGVDGGAAFGFGFVAGLLFGFLPAFFDLPTFPAGFAGGVAVGVPRADERVAGGGSRCQLVEILRLGAFGVGVLSTSRVTGFLNPLPSPVPLFPCSYAPVSANFRRLV